MRKYKFNWKNTSILTTFLEEYQPEDIEFEHYSLNIIFRHENYRPTDISFTYNLNKNTGDVTIDYTDFIDTIINQGFIDPDEDTNNEEQMIDYIMGTDNINLNNDIFESISDNGRENVNYLKDLKTISDTILNILQTNNVYRNDIVNKTRNLKTVSTLNKPRISNNIKSKIGSFLSGESGSLKNQALILKQKGNTPFVKKGGKHKSKTRKNNCQKRR